MSAPRSGRGWRSSPRWSARRSGSTTSSGDLGDSTNTSWMPPAVAWVNTGPRLVTTNGALPSKAGYRLGTTRTSHCPSAPPVSRVGVTVSSLPGTERAGPGGVGLDRRHPGGERLGSGGPVGADHHPAAGEGIESELVHQTVRSAPRDRRHICAHVRATSIPVFRRASLAPACPRRDGPRATGAMALT